MNTKSSRSRDDLVLDAIERVGLGVRELLRHALGGVDPNNIVHRLVAKNRITSIQGALPQNRAYYLPRGEKPLGSVALSHRLALACFVQLPSRSTRIPLKRAELRSIFGDQTPPGAHVLQTGPADRPRVMLVYTPDTELIAEGILRVADRASAFPKVAEAMKSKDYGIAVLVPWNSGLAPKLRRAAAGASVPGLGALHRTQPLATKVHLVVDRVASPQTLTQALRETRGGGS